MDDNKLEKILTDLNELKKEQKRLDQDQVDLKTSQAVLTSKLQDVVEHLKEVSTNIVDISMKFEGILTRFEQNDTCYHHFVQVIDRLEKKILPPAEMKERIKKEFEDQIDDFQEKVDKKIEKIDNVTNSNTKHIWIAVGAVSAITFILTLVTQINIS